MLKNAIQNKIRMFCDNIERKKKRKEKKTSTIPTLKIDIFERMWTKQFTTRKTTTREREWVRSRAWIVCEHTDMQHTIHLIFLRKKRSSSSPSSLYNWKKKDSLEVNVLPNRNVYTQKKPEENPCPINAAINFYIIFLPPHRIVFCVCVCVCAPGIAIRTMLHFTCLFSVEIFNGLNTMRLWN